MDEKIKLVMVTLSMEERHGWLHPSIANFLWGYAANHPKIFTKYSNCNNFVPAASARNMICNVFRGSDSEWLCMVDNDMVIPNNLFDCLTKAPADAQIVVPQFFMWDGTKCRVKICWGFTESNEGVDAACDFLVKPETFYPIVKFGTGVIFIKKEVLLALHQPYFFYSYNELQGMTSTEDINFALNCKKQGIKAYGYSGVKVGHYHSVNLLDIASILYSVPEAECPSNQEPSTPSVSPTA